MLSAAGIAVWPAYAAASELNGDSGKPAFSDSGNLTGSMIWVVISLFLVIGLIVVVMKFLSQKSRVWGTNRSLRSLGGVALGQNNSLQVVELAGRLYIVGVGENVTLLDKVESGEQAQQIIAALERQSSGSWSGGSVSELLGRFRKRGTEAESPEGQWNTDSASFQAMLNDKLNRQADRKQQLESLLKDDKPNERLMDDNEK
ncbi:FliO/MopB family protein [Paenibacillus sp. NPDC058174]|uniref:FliO/MopB family protein n=1 Tax=Paenibacillus sp. NPDC058174 TaxID=3346366 RepID=UPI0036DDBB6F